MSGIWPQLTSFWPRRANDPQHSSQIQRLPLELWAMIIEFMIDEIRHPYRHCTPGTFSRFQRGLLHFGSVEQDPFLSDWRTIRSVCRTWKRFAGPRPHLNAPRIFLPKDRTLKEASSLFMGYPMDQTKTLNYLVQNPTLSCNLTTLIFSHTFTDHRNVIDILLDRPSIFPSLRCLVLPNVNTNRPFWQRIQDGFPKLVALVIHQYRDTENGHYTLKNLEILDITPWIKVTLSCPALKHLSIRGYTTNMMIDFFQLHSHQLESLLLEPQRPTLLTEGPQKFWAAFPNLELLGIYPNEPDFCGPRSTHPLRHLRLFSYRGSITPDIVLSEIRSFKTVTHVHITVDDLLSTEESSNLVKELRDRCRARGVAVVELPRMKIPRISDRYEWWTIPIVKAVLDSVGVVWK